MIRLVCAWMVVNGVLLAPSWVSTTLTGAPRPPLLSVEAALIVGGMTLLPRRPWSRIVAWIVAAGVVAAAVVQLGNLVFMVSLGRPLNLSVDLYLLDAVRRLAVGNVGAFRTVVLVVAILLVGGLALYAMGRLLLPEERADRRFSDPVHRVAGGIAVATLLLALLGLGVDEVGRRVTAPAWSLLREQVALFVDTRREKASFAADLEEKHDGFRDVPGLLEGLGGRNVVVAYLESYGIAALDDPEFAAVIHPRLETAQSRLDSAGLHLVTGRFTSPTLGGQSWYAHDTMLSGLWLENQLRYELLLASGRTTLVDDFHRAGYRAATIMPAITTPWPEARRLGFDDVYTSRNIPYDGPSFYWVTMPDQFTWSFLSDVLEGATTPLFVEVGMVSSHAPWTPVLPLLDWDRMGDGAVFEPYRQEGYPPEEIWWDVDVLRDGYARSLAYSVEAMAEFAERFLDERTLLIVPGDHQAAPWVTGAEGADVPVHVIARDPALVEPFLEWGFQPGAFPPAARAAHRMDEFREWLVRSYSGEPLSLPTAPSRPEPRPSSG